MIKHFGTQLAEQSDGKTGVESYIHTVAAVIVY